MLPALSVRASSRLLTARYLTALSTSPPPFLPHAKQTPPEHQPLAFFLFQRHGDRAPAHHLFDDRPLPPSTIGKKGELDKKGERVGRVARGGGEEESGLGEFGGIVVGRDGDSSGFWADGGLPICEDLETSKKRDRERELTYWSSQVVNGTEEAILANERFKVDRSAKSNSSNSDHHHFIDTHNPPFGHLTHHGFKQLRQVGVDLNEYLRYGEWKWAVNVISTNYLRTVTSAQALLSGLIAKDSAAGKNNPAVKIREHDVCTLNAYDRDPVLMRRLVKEVKEGPEWRLNVEVGDHDATGEGKYKPVGVWDWALQRFFGGRRRVEGNRDYDLNWIHIFDHLTTQSYHPSSDLPTIIDHDNKEKIIAKIKRALNSRFAVWYSNSQIIGSVGHPPLSEICDVMRECIPVSGESVGSERCERPLHIYSAHDVTLLSLLHAVGADDLLRIDSHSDGFWPPYASSVTIELTQEEKVIMKCNGTIFGDYTFAEFEAMVNKLNV